MAGTGEQALQAGLDRLRAASVSGPSAKRPDEPIELAALNLIV